MLSMSRKVLLLLALMAVGGGAKPCFAAGRQHTVGPTYGGYGYNPYQSHYGPVYAQRELDWLGQQPRIHGLDYGYGLGYFFGLGPPHHYGNGLLAAPAAAGRSR